tara:strand:+ start:5153 stop:5623 length:471 start_codon:yes stop_codon:yes gene_type:complete
MKFKIKTINEWALKNMERCDMDLSFLENSSIEACFEECTDVVESFMKRNGFYAKDGYIHYPFEIGADAYTKRDNINLLTQIVIEAYEGCFSQHDDFVDEKGRNKFWTIFGCSGDDDVDYNSSYFDCTIEILELYVIDNKIDSWILRKLNNTNKKGE